MMFGIDVPLVYGVSSSIGERACIIDQGRSPSDLLILLRPRLALLISCVYLQ
jgi:hypothetical protein